MDKGSGSGIFPDPDPRGPKRQDPTGSGSATLVKTTSKITLCLCLTYYMKIVHLYIFLTLIFVSDVSGNCRKSCALRSIRVDPKLYLNPVVKPALKSASEPASKTASLLPVTNLTELKPTLTDQPKGAYLPKNIILYRY